MTGSNFKTLYRRQGNRLYQLRELYNKQVKAAMDYSDNCRNNDIEMDLDRYYALREEYLNTAKRIWREAFYHFGCIHSAANDYCKSYDIQY